MIASLHFRAANRYEDAYQLNIVIRTVEQCSHNIGRKEKKERCIKSLVGTRAKVEQEVFEKEDMNYIQYNKKKKNHSFIK